MQGMCEAGEARWVWMPLAYSNSFCCTFLPFRDLLGSVLMLWVHSAGTEGALPTCGCQSSCGGLRGFTPGLGSEHVSVLFVRVKTAG